MIGTNIVILQRNSKIVGLSSVYNVLAVTFAHMFVLFSLMRLPVAHKMFFKRDIKRFLADSSTLFLRHLPIDIERKKHTHTPPHPHTPKEISSSKTTTIKPYVQKSNWLRFYVGEISGIT